MTLGSAIAGALRSTLARTSRHRVRAGLVVAGVVLVLGIAIGVAEFLSRLHALRAMTASGPSWGFPSRVYSADVLLAAGALPSRSRLLRELDARGYARGTPDRLRPGSYAVTGDGILIGLRGFRDAPDPRGSGGPERVRVTVAGARCVAIRRMGGYGSAAPPDLAHPPRLEPVLFSVVLDSARVRRTWVPLERIPPIVREAVIASEDRRFRRHTGLDLRSNARALFANLRTGSVRQGASTLTQQLARGLFLGRERTLARKLQEAVLAVGLELALSKDEILEMYLNSVYWGQDGAEGIAGVAEAARHYFGVPVDSLGLGQAALLAGLIPAPNTLSPFRNPKLARRARDRVLQDLREVGAIGAAAERAARAAPLAARHVPPPAERFAWFSNSVRDELSRRMARGAAARRGLCVFSTLDVGWQGAADSLLTAELSDLEPGGGRGSNPLQGAFVAIEPRSGAVRAIVGGRRDAPSDFNRATQARRQPGSAIKPIVYAAALDPDRGDPRFTPASTVPDLRRDFATPEGPWHPRNDQEDYHPQVTLAKALAKSLNVATANLVEAIRPGTVTRYAERFGLGRFKAVASVGLGTNEVTLYSLAAAYGVFADAGWRVEPTTIASIVDAFGHDATPKALTPERVLPPQTAALMTGLLEDVVTFGVAYPLRKVHGFAPPVAGKTGTTNDYNDAWFVGFTPELIAGVWVGCDRPRSMAAPAADIAIPVWARIMSPLTEGFVAREFGSDRTLELAWIDPYSGGLARGDCPRPMRVPFLPGTAPRQPCRVDHALDWERIRAEAAADSAAVEPPPAEIDTTVSQP